MTLNISKLRYSKIGQVGQYLVDLQLDEHRRIDPYLFCDVDARNCAFKTIYLTCLIKQNASDSMAEFSSSTELESESCLIQQLTPVSFSIRPSPRPGTTRFATHVLVAENHFLGTSFMFSRIGTTYSQLLPRIYVCPIALCPFSLLPAIFLIRHS